MFPLIAPVNAVFGNHHLRPLGNSSRSNHPRTGCDRSCLFPSLLASCKPLFHRHLLRPRISSFFRFLAEDPASSPQRSRHRAHRPQKPQGPAHGPPTCFSHDNSTPRRPYQHAAAIRAVVNPICLRSRTPRSKHLGMILSMVVIMYITSREYTE